MVEDKIAFVRVGLFYACFCRDGAIVNVLDAAWRKMMKN